MIPKDVNKILKILRIFIKNLEFGNNKNIMNAHTITVNFVNHFNTLGLHFLGTTITKISLEISNNQKIVGEFVKSIVSLTPKTTCTY